MKLGAIILSVLVLFGCAASVGYYKTEHKHKEILVAGQERAEQEKVQIQLEENRKITETIKVARERHTVASAGEPVGGYPMPKSMPVSEDNIIKIQKTETVSSKLFSAALVFVVADKTNIEDSIKAQLLIDPNQTVEEIDKKVVIKGSKIKQNVKVSKVVKAKLTAPDFKIDELTDEEQILSDDKSTEWLWKLTPTQPGTFEVNVTVTAIISVDGRESKHHLKTFDRSVIVEVTKDQVLKAWFDENWKWLVSTLVMPFLVFLFKDKVKEKLKRFLD